MTISEAIYILDPQTTRDALRPYGYDPEGRIRIVEDACRVVCAALRAQQQAEKKEPLCCTECFYLEEDCAPCAHCIRAAGYADYYRRKPEEGRK